MNTCKTCRFWGADGVCGGIDISYEILIHPWDTNKINNLDLGDRAEIEIDATDDSGLDGLLRTGPDFGCTLHEEKPDA